MGCVYLACSAGGAHWWAEFFLTDGHRRGGWVLEDLEDETEIKKSWDVCCNTPRLSRLHGCHHLDGGFHDINQVLLWLPVSIHSHSPWKLVRRRRRRSGPDTNCVVASGGNHCDKVAPWATSILWEVETSTMFSWFSNDITVTSIHESRMVIWSY